MQIYIYINKLLGHIYFIVYQWTERTGDKYFLSLIYFLVFYQVIKEDIILL